MLFLMATNDFCVNNTMYTKWIRVGPFFSAYHANIKRKRIMITDNIPIQYKNRIADVVAFNQKRLDP